MIIVIRNVPDGYAPDTIKALEQRVAGIVSDLLPDRDQDPYAVTYGYPLAKRYSWGPVAGEMIAITIDLLPNDRLGAHAMNEATRHIRDVTIELLGSDSSVFFRTLVFQAVLGATDEG